MCACWNVFLYQAADCLDSKQAVNQDVKEFERCKNGLLESSSVNDTIEVAGQRGAASCSCSCSFLFFDATIEVQAAGTRSLPRLLHRSRHGVCTQQPVFSRSARLAICPSSFYRCLSVCLSIAVLCIDVSPSSTRPPGMVPLL